MLPSDIVNAKGEKIDPKACATTLPECPVDSGLAPYYDPSNDTCRCVPSVGHKARESFSKYAVPFLELVARDGGAFGFRKIPDYVAKRKDNNTGELISALHTCWCDLDLEDTWTTYVGDGTPSVLTFKLDQSYGQSHVIGRFRLSVSTNASAIDAVPVPAPIMEIVKIPADQRTPQQKATLGVYYRSIDPALAADTVRLETLRFLLAPQA